MNVQCIGDVPAPDITVVTDEADNCSATADIAVAFVSDSALAGSNPGTITRTYSVTDQAGNSINVAQTITVDDTIFPTASDPLPVNVQCIGDVPAPDIAVVTDGADNCSATADISVAFVTDSPLAGSNPGTITRTYSVTDQAGNSINVAQTITVDDTIFPTASDPLDINVECAGEVPEPDITVVTDEADNCSATADISVAFVSDSPIVGMNPGFITRTYRITDQAGNSIETIQLITIDITEPPEFVDDLPQDIILGCMEEAPAPEVLTAIDNCGDAVVVEFSEQRIENPCTRGFDLQRTWTATDVSGNVISHTQIMTIVCPLKVYNAISLNEGSRNDRLRIEFIECYPDNNIVVFNRLGGKVFETKSYDNENNFFSGTPQSSVLDSSNGKLPTGTYFYVLKYNVTTYSSSYSERNEQSGYLYIN